MLVQLVVSDLGQIRLIAYGVVSNVILLYCIALYTQAFCTEFQGIFLVHGLCKV